MALNLTGREGGNRVAKPGIYHVAIQRVDDTFNKMDKVIVEMEVLAGNVADQVGRTHTEFFATTDKALPRLGIFACAIGLLNDGESREVELSQAEGRQMIVQIEEHSYKNDAGEEKGGVRLAFEGMWKIGSEKAPQCPMCEKAMNLVPGAAASSNGNGQPAQAQAQTQLATAAAGAASNWNDI